MSEHWSRVGSEQPYAQSEVTDPWGANGASPDGAVGARDESTATATELPVEESVLASEGEAAAGSADPDADVDDGSVFMAMLVRAMQTTASVERIRVTENTERRRQADIDRVRARQASEANRMRELANEDMRAIDAWAEEETKRIQYERERRAMEVNEDLETSLSGHHRTIDREIEGIEAAVATYRADVEAFFASLDNETDLVAIAQQAGRRPVFPILDAVASVAEPPTEEVPTAGDEVIEAGAAGATETERPLVAVMDTQAAADRFQTWAADPSTSPEAAPARADEEVTDGAQVPEPAEPVATGGSWSWRDAVGGDRSNRET